MKKERENKKILSRNISFLKSFSTRLKAVCDMIEIKSNKSIQQINETVDKNLHEKQEITLT